MNSSGPHQKHARTAAPADDGGGLSSSALVSAEPARSRLSSALLNPGLWRVGIRGPVLEGLFGSLLVLFGSFGVGWLANASTINRWDWVIPLRTTAEGVTVTTIALTVGCWLMFRAWLRLGRALRGWPGGSLSTINWATAVWSLPHLICLPIFSRDVYAYVNQGRLVLAGEDPYMVGVSQLDNWFHFGTDIMWAHSETPYGPMFLWIEALVMRITDNAVDPSIFLFRLVCVAGVVLIMVFVPKLARLLGVDSARAQWLTAANPLFIISFISSAHNDSLMMGFALAGIYAAARGRGVLATVLVAVSIGMKLITIVLLPFIGLLWAAYAAHRRGLGQATWLMRFTYWFLTAGISGAVLLVVGWANGYGIGWLGVLAGTGDTGKSFWSPMGIADTMLTDLLLVFGMDADWTLDTMRVVGRLSSVVIVIALMFLGRDRHIVQRMTWAFTALVVLSPIIHPWYLLWLLPLFAVTGIRNDWQTKWVFFTVGFFICYGAQDQLHVWQFLDMDEQMLRTSLFSSIICMVLIGLMRGTRWAVFNGWVLSPITVRIPWSTDEQGRRKTFTVFSERGREPMP